MILLASYSAPLPSFAPNNGTRISRKFSRRRGTTLKFFGIRIRSQLSATSYESKESKQSFESESPLCCGRFCSCGRRRFIEAVGTALLPIYSSSAADLRPEDPMTVLNKIHPPRPDWYEEFYALALDKFTKSYEAEIAGYKSQLFANLRGKNKILEIGIGTGPNLKYYAGNTGVTVFGVDPNRKMEKYALEAAETAGLSPTNFKFMQAVVEGLPLSDDSVDAVVGTLVLCSVKDVDLALQEVRRVLKPGGLFLFIEHEAAKDGSFLRFVQRMLNPLQQIVADGCHLTRTTGKSICDAGFSSVDINTAFLSTASIINPHAYGIARK